MGFFHTAFWPHKEIRGQSKKRHSVARYTGIRVGHGSGALSSC